MVIRPSRVPGTAPSLRPLRRSGISGLVEVIEAARGRPQGSLGRHAHPRRRLRRWVRRPSTGPGRGHDCEPRELHALHPDPARGGLGNPRAAARRRAATRHVSARGASARPCDRPRRSRAARHGRERPRDPPDPLQAARGGARRRLAHAACAWPRRARPRVQEPGRRDLPPKSRATPARRGGCGAGAGRAVGAPHVRIRRSRLCRGRGACRALGSRRRRASLLPESP